MWSWDGHCWASVQPAGDPPGDRAASGMTTYDPDGKRILLFGSAPSGLRQVWSWAGGQWSRLGDSPASPNNLGGGAGYDVARHQLVVVAMPPAFRVGFDDPSPFSMDTWLLDGTSWHRADPVHKLPFIGSTEMVFDPSSGHLLIPRTLADTSEVWSWDGRDWGLTPQQIPTHRGVLVDGGDLGILALDAGDPLDRPGHARRVFRLQGGLWSATRPVTVGPTYLTRPAYDQHRKELVSFGDIFQPDSSHQLFTQDTWTWTVAAGWTRHLGPAPTASPSPSPPPPIPSPTPCPSPTPLSSFAAPAPAPSDRTLALVTLSGSDQVVARDITDINHPSTIATLSLAIAGGPSIVEPHQPTFVNANEVAFDDNGLRRIPIAGSPKVQGPVVCPGPLRFAWSRDGQSLTYLAGFVETTQGGETLRLEWHVVSGGSDRVIGTAPGWRLGVDFGGWDVYDYRVAFSPDGSYLSFVENFVGAADFQVRRMDGTLVTQIKSTGNWAADPTMSVWSGSTLYFRDSKGVEAWKDGTVTPFLPGVAWIRPTASPSGGQITYAVSGADGLPHVYVVDTGTRTVVQLTNTPAADPVFLSPGYIWYVGLQLCNPGCGYGNLQLTGKTYIYDLQARTEAQSRITAVFDVWPHGS